MLYRVLAYTHEHTKRYSKPDDFVLIGEYNTLDEADEAGRHYAENKENGALWVHIVQEWN